jgi:hypothetical protein
MFKLYEITNILLEQDTKLDTLRKSISGRFPISINYIGPPGEVLSGDRLDIRPVVLGKNKKSGNLVIWAYVSRGISKKGLPGWKMFRVDRINDIKINQNVEPFKLTDIPEYQKGKFLKSLSNVEIISPYWFEDDIRFKSKLPPKPKKEKPIEPTEPIKMPEKEPIKIEKPPAEEPEKSIPSPSPEEIKKFGKEIYDELTKDIVDINGKKFISYKDYDNAFNNLYKKKEGEWKNYQRELQGNVRPGEGTRERFKKESEKELLNLLKRDSVEIHPMYELKEIYLRFKSLIK